MSKIAEVREVSNCEEGLEKVNELLGAGWRIVRIFLSKRFYQHPTKGFQEVGPEIIYVLGR